MTYYIMYNSFNGQFKTVSLSDVKNVIVSEFEDLIRLVVFSVANSIEAKHYKTTYKQLRSALTYAKAILTIMRLDDFDKIGKYLYLNELLGTSYNIDVTNYVEKLMNEGRNVEANELGKCKKAIRLTSPYGLIICEISEQSDAYG
ncbi:MAG: hypothetical protein QXR31_04475 [Zestosphaera sp.]